LAVVSGTQEEYTIPIPRRHRGGVLGIIAYGWYLSRRYPVVPGIILTLLILAAIIGPTVAPFERDQGTLRGRDENGDLITVDGCTFGEPGCKVFVDTLLPPFTTSPISDPPRYGLWPDGFHLLGTDSSGRDIFTRLLHGARISMQVVFVSLFVGGIIGTTLGITAGYYGGIADELITRFVDIWYAMPFLMVALVVTLIFGRGLTVLMFVLAMIAWSAFVRVIRAQVLVLKEMDYVASARINGASDIRIMFRHLFPGVLNTAIVVATLNTSGLILSESVLSFVGAGIQPPTPAWGVMTNESRNYIYTAPHAVLIPGGAIFLVVLSLNFLGDWLRDRLDPRLRQVD
jgi:ABC-type dipeptide/oligopeptide/nickel transport system permease subunit